MRRAAAAILSTVVGLVLLLSFKTHTGATSTRPSSALGVPRAGGVPPSPGPTAATSPPGGTQASTGPSGPAPTTSAAAGSGAGAAGSRTYTGAPVITRYGPVQVQVTITDGKITDIPLLELPTDNPRDQEINNYAVPVLQQEALTAQSANIDVVSGATYTSQGYAQSLQSALDQAHA